jgi:Endonuclease NucS
MTIREDDIRDELADKLALIEDELSLIDVNYPLPNSEGTRGFIDILARDRYGVFVVVELKRSNKTSREALHEVMKYTELLQREIGVDKSEIRAVIVSTHWDELRVPFSHLKRGWPVELRGYLLTLNEDGITPIAASEVTPLAELSERGVTPIHLILRRRGTAEIDLIWHQSTALLNEVGADDALGIVLEHPVYGLFLYLVIGRMVPDDPRTMLLDKLAEDIPDNTVEAPEGYALEYRALCYTTERYSYETVEIEIAHPEKFKALRVNDHCEVKRILRAGIFALQKNIYPDELLLGRIVDKIGQSQVRFSGSSRPANHRHWIQFKTNIVSCLRCTADWRDTIAAWIDETAKTAPDKSVVCQVYNLNDLMASFVFGWPDRIGSFLPSIEASVDGPPNEGRLVRGTLVWTGTRVESIFEAVYSVYPEPFEWSAARLFGVAWESDLELLARLNLRYALFEWSNKFTTGTLLELNDGHLERKRPEGRERGQAIWSSARPFPQFLSDHAEEITRVTDYFRASCGIS